MTTLSLRRADPNVASIIVEMHELHHAHNFLAAPSLEMVSRTIRSSEVAHFILLAARQLYERHGFVYEGTYRDGFRNPVSGAFEDLCIDGLLADELKSAAPP